MRSARACRGKNCWLAAVRGGRTMLRLASDADVHGDILNGLHRRLPEIDLVRVQDALPEQTPDPEVLAWAAAESRVLITNDRNTMVGFAYQRVAAGEPVPGLITTTNEQSVGSAIDDILLVAVYMPEEEIRGPGRRLPALPGIESRRGKKGPPDACHGSPEGVRATSFFFFCAIKHAPRGARAHA